MADRHKRDRTNGILLRVETLSGTGASGMLLPVVKAAPTHETVQPMPVSVAEATARKIALVTTGPAVAPRSNVRHFVVRLSGPPIQGRTASIIPAIRMAPRTRRPTSRDTMSGW
jgi:hypothetical protein